MTHLVNRLTFDLLCPAEEQAFDIRRQVASIVVQQQVQELLDRVCSQYAGEEKWINIEQLEIDLGVFSPESFTTAFTGSFLQKLEAELSAQLARLAPGVSPHSRQVSEMELLQYLLLHGALPWWGTALEPAMDALCSEAIQYSAGSFTHFLLQHRFNQSLWQRISYQLNTASRQQIIELLPVLSGVAVQLQEWIDNVYKKPGSVEPPAATIQQIIQRIILENAPRLFQNSEPLDIHTLIAGRPAASWLEADARILQSLSTEANAPIVLPKLGATAIPGTGTKNNAVAEEEPEKFFIKTGGIVLLSPFLKPFFTELGLLDGDQWINKAAAYRAVHLLKWLGTGQEQQPEYDLLLEKICCSLPPEEPVPVDIELEEKEMQEAVNLLTAVIGHWSALKNTSIAGLRESFFKRDAILTRRQNGWLLQVERKTLDVLVDRIPWVYHPVRLPWNDYLIMVEW